MLPNMKPSLFAVLLILLAGAFPLHAVLTADVSLDDGSWTFNITGDPTLTTEGPTPELLWTTGGSSTTSRTASFTYSGDLFDGLTTTSESGSGTAYIGLEPDGGSFTFIDFSLEFDDLGDNGDFTNLVITPTGNFATTDLSLGSYNLSSDIIGNENLSFSIVPEPATVGLITLGALALALGRRKRR